MEDESSIYYYFNICACLASCIIFFLLVFKLWDLPIYKNCWFCNNNEWVQFSQRNSWICLTCQQYNGFSSNGDYNKVLQTHLKNPIYYNRNRKRPQAAHNGLCHSCNINQHLKVLQLANFKPIVEKNFDTEVEAFNVHLDDVYKLCHLCRRLVNKKIQMEKGNFLVKKRIMPNAKKSSVLLLLFSFLKRTVIIVLKYMSITLLICILIDITINAELFLSKKMIQSIKQHYRNISLVFSTKTILNDDILISVRHLKEIIVNSTFYDIPQFLQKEYMVKEVLKNKVLNSHFTRITLVSGLQVLASAGGILQGLLYLSEPLSLKYLTNLAVWATSYYISCAEDKLLHVFQLLCAIILISNTFSKAEDKVEKKDKSPIVSKRMKNLSNSSFVSSVPKAELTSDDSDDDITHQRTSTPDYFKIKPADFPTFFTEEKYRSPKPNIVDNFHNTSQYDKKTANGFYYNSYLKNNQTFGSGKSLWHRNVSDNDSDLDESISTLNLGKRNKRSKDSSFVFSTKKYNTSNMFMRSPAPMIRRPVLSPSHFTPGPQQSWVAGGYWGMDSPKQVYNVHDTSRSSSQSSGFESLTSGHRIGSFPPSRAESVAGDYSKKSDYCDRNVFSTFSTNTSAFQSIPEDGSTIRASVANSRPLFYPHSVSYDCSTNLKNLNILNSPLTPNLNNSFMPVVTPHIATSGSLRSALS